LFYFSIYFAAATHNNTPTYTRTSYTLRYTLRLHRSRCRSDQSSTNSSDAIAAIAATAFTWSRGTTTAYAG